MTNSELDAINRLSENEANRFWTAISSIREPACCSLVNENRFRLADYALKYYVNDVIFLFSGLFYPCFSYACRVQRQAILIILN